jgi:excisionase family DNA binding protein
MQEYSWMGTTTEDRQALKGTAFTATIPGAGEFSGLSRSEIYRLLASQQIRAVKSGKRTLILMDTLKAHLENLPPAQFRAPAKAA